MWSDAATGLPVLNGGAPMLRGVQSMRDPDDPSRLLAVDVTPRRSDGGPITPPVVPPES
ncbi:hypothetical protein ACFWA9_19455 [Kitasatospora sp. NPDC059973]|uniref:hypothetical protein n=1 Tax=Kitasatospora sp. NPDC059973 TaxID=3347020 RepID=UPI0036C34481